MGDQDISTVLSISLGCNECRHMKTTDFSIHRLWKKIDGKKLENKSNNPSNHSNLV